MSGVVHGGVQPEELRALGLDPADVLDLSANLHPAGPDAAVIEAARTAQLDRYPAPDAAPLRAAIARASGLDPSQVLVTPGATAALHLVARALLHEGDRCAILGPTFGEYAAATLAAGGVPVPIEACAPAFDPPVDDPRIEDAAMTVLCNPNNPTGRYLSRDAVASLAERSRVLVLDAAYSDFVADAWDPDGLVRDGLPVVVVHSMTKLHAIPGLRLGYVASTPTTTARLARLLPAWSVDAAAQAAGLVAIGQHAERIALLAGLPEARDRLAEACADVGWAVVGGAANFILARTGDGAATRLALLRHGIAVRDCASFGLPEWVRIAVPGASSVGRVAEAIRAAGGAR